MKCEKCGKAEATVYYSVVSGKFKATRKRYCKPCMETERVRLVVPAQPAATPQAPQSLIDLVQGEMAKQDSKPEGKKDESPASRVKALEQKMKMAIREERYEDAAKARDEIASLQKQAKPPDDHPGQEPAVKS